MLTASLRGLERDGYVSRSVTPTVPAMVDYALTGLGRDVLAPVTAVAEWDFLSRHCVEAAREKFDSASLAATTPVHAAALCTFIHG